MIATVINDNGFFQTETSTTLINVKHFAKKKVHNSDKFQGRFKQKHAIKGGTIHRQQQKMFSFYLYDIII